MTCALAPYPESFEERFADPETIVLYAGESLPWEIQLTRADGTPLPLGDGVFVASIVANPLGQEVRSQRGLVAGIEADPYVAGEFDGATIAALAARPGLRFQIAQIFALGRTILVDDTLRVLRAPAELDADLAGLPAGGTFRRYAISRTVRGIRRIITLRGTPGLSAAEQVARIRPEEIAGTTDQAFVDWVEARVGANFDAVADPLLAARDAAAVSAATATNRAIAAGGEADRAAGAAGFADQRAEAARISDENAAAEADLAIAARAQAVDAAGTATDARAAVEVDRAIAVTAKDQAIAARDQAVAAVTTLTPLPPTRSPPGGAAAGQTVITAPAPVPAGAEHWIEVIWNTAPQDEDQYVTDGSDQVTLNFAMNAGDTWCVRQRWRQPDA